MHTLLLSLALVVSRPAPPPVPARPMVVLTGSVTNTMWPIRDVPAMEKSAAFARSLGVDAFETYVTWGVLEPSAEGRTDYAETDKLDGICRRTGLKWQAFLMLNPSYATPKWYRESGADVPARCLEHGRDSDVRSIFAPGLERHVDRVIAGLLERYRGSSALESLMLGVSGDFGESIYPAGAVGWNGQYHNHAGFWCAEPPAVAAFQSWARRKFGAIARLNRAWGARLSSFEELRFLLPGQPMGDARWIDQAEWYRGAMTAWCEVWLRSARRHAPPGLPIYLCVGGGDNVPLGFDITGQARLCARYGAYLRLTNEGSDYAGNFMGTRQLTAAAKLYGVPAGLEPAGDVNARGVSARIFGAAAAGCNHLHYYEGQVANFQAATAAADRTDAWNAGRRHLVQKAPWVNIAAWYPRIDALAKRQMSVESLSRYGALRDYTDFDFVDDNLVRDGKLARYRYLLLGPCAAMDAGAYRALMDWVRAGGVLIASAGPALRLWDPAASRLTPAAPLAPRAAVWSRTDVRMPARFTFHPGHAPSAVELAGDWSHPEGDYRWGGRTAALRIAVDPALSYRLKIRGGVPVGGAVLANGREIGRMEGASGNEQTWDFDLPRALLAGRETLTLEFRLQPMKLATDPRDLCIYPSEFTLETPGGDPALTEPSFAPARIDARALAASTTRLGAGRIVGLRDAGLSADRLARAVAALLRTERLPCALPDGRADGLFVACRGDEALVYNSGAAPITADLSIPAGAELDRTRRAAGQTIRLRALAPGAIAAFPLRLAPAR